MPSGDRARSWSSGSRAPRSTALGVALLLDEIESPLLLVRQRLPGCRLEVPHPSSRAEPPPAPPRAMRSFAGMQRIRYLRRGGCGVQTRFPLTTGSQFSPLRRLPIPLPPRWWPGFALRAASRGVDSRPGLLCLRPSTRSVPFDRIDRCHSECDGGVVARQRRIPPRRPRMRPMGAERSTRSTHPTGLGGSRSRNTGESVYMGPPWRTPHKAQPWASMHADYHVW